MTFGKLPVGDRAFRVGGIYENTPLVFDFVTSTRNLTQAGFADSDNFLIVFTSPQAGELLRPLQQKVENLPVVTVQDEQQFADQQRAPIDQLVLMVDALLGLALVIAVLGIVNTLALSIIERTREIGLLRAIGLGRGQLRLMVTLESVVMALLGAVLGVALGRLLRHGDDVRRARPGAERDRDPLVAAGRLPRPGGRDRRARGRAPGPACGRAGRADGHLDDLTDRLVARAGHGCPPPWIPGRRDALDALDSGAWMTCSYRSVRRSSTSRCGSTSAA